MAQKQTPLAMDSNNSIYRLAIAQIIGIAVLIACGILGVFYFLTNQIYEAEAKQTQTSLVQLVTIAKTAVDPIAREVQSGNLTIEEGQNMARDIVRRMVYQDSYGANYIFMSSYEGIMLVQPFASELEGSNQFDLIDVNGKYIIRSLIEAARAKPSGSFVTYHYPPPRSTTPEEKISYVMGIPEINAYIGAGIYPTQAYKQQQTLLLILGFVSVLLLGLLAALTVQTIKKVKQTADSLIRQKNAEENLSTVFNSTHDAILVHDQYGKIVAANPAMAKMYRIRPADATTMNVRDISADDSMQSFLLEDLWMRVSQGENLLFDWISIRPADKSIIDVEVSLSQISWNDTPHFLAVIRDVTDRNKIQADLEKNEWLLEHAQSLAHIGHFYYELATQQLTWSKELFHIYGLDPQAVPPTHITFPQMTIGKNIQSEAIQSSADASLQERIATDYQIIRPDGSARHLVLVMDYVRDAGDQIIAYVGTVQDITENYEIADSLRTTTLKLETALENIPYDIWGFDTKEVYTVQNKESLKKWGNLIGAQFRDVRIPDDIKSDWMDNNRQVLAGKNVEKISSRIYNGKLQHIHTIISPIKDHEVVIGGLGVDIDITQQVESTLRAERALVKSNVGHEIDQLILRHSDLNATMDLIAEKAMVHLGVNAVAILIRDSDSDQLVLSGQKGIPESTRDCISRQLSCKARELVLTTKQTIDDSDIDWPVIEKGCPCWEEGGFKHYIGTPILSNQECVGIFELFYIEPIQRNDEWKSFLSLLVGQAAIAFENTRLYQDLASKNVELASAYDATIQGWSKALELKDKETKGHSERVMDLSCKLARMMSYPEKDMTHFRRGVLLHDIGKMGIPEAILLKPGPLTDEEWVIMKQHPGYAYSLLENIEHLKPSLDIPYCHHERWDGSGYPRQLQGKDIPLAARIFMVVDVWDALISDRPYRPGWNETKTSKYIRQNAGIQFDPEVVDAFLRLIHQ